MVIFWAGYAFSRDYTSPRGHMHAIEDVTRTLRTGNPDIDGDGDIQPATCWTCKSPDVPRMMQAIGVDNFYKSKWSQMGSEIVNPIGCADCHDTETMDLHISRPALVEAFARRGVDITKATHQEMRSLVCAQCHVEYYFKGDGKYLTFPWDKGFTMEDRRRALLRRSRLLRLYTYSQPHSDTQGAASRFRDSTAGHTRTERRIVCRLPHAI